MLTLYAFVLWLHAPGILPQESAGQTGKASEPYFDLESPYSKPTQVDARQSLRMIVRTSRIGDAGLNVRVEVWNQADNDRRVPPINPMFYEAEYRDASGRPVDIYPHLPLVDPATPSEEEFTLVRSRHALVANLRRPTFFKRIRAGARLQVRVNARLHYAVARDFNNLVRFELVSEWVDIPQVKTVAVRTKPRR
jgi:hypothetical protein